MSLSASVFAELTPFKTVPAYELVHAIYGHINATILSMGAALLGSRLRGNDEGEAGMMKEGLGITSAGLGMTRVGLGITNRAQ